MPGKLNLKIYKGETFRHVLLWKDASETPIDLDGYRARMHIRKKIDDADPPLVTLTTENSKIEIVAAEGKIVLRLAATETAAYTWLEAVYDLELVMTVDGVDEVTRLVEGKVTTFKEVTR